MTGVIQQAREAFHTSNRPAGCQCFQCRALRAVVEAADAGYLIDTRTRRDGDAIVIGPECFASADELVICWKGVNYYAPMDGNVLAAAEREAS